MKRWKGKAEKLLVLLTACAMLAGTTTVFAASGDDYKLYSDGGGELAVGDAFANDSDPQASIPGEVSADEINEDTSEEEVPNPDGPDLPIPGDISGETEGNDGETGQTGGETEGIGDDSSTIPFDALLTGIPDLELDGVTGTPDSLDPEIVVGDGETGVIPDGLYIFEVYPDGVKKQAMAVKGNSQDDYAYLITGSFTESNVRYFYIENIDGTYYRIRSLHTGKCLQVEGNKTADGTKVRQKTEGTTTAQQWKFVRSGDGYQIIGRKSGKALNVKDGKAGNILEISTLSDAPSQVWYPSARTKLLMGAGSSVTWPGYQGYTGSNITPDVTVSVYGEQLTLGEDYELTYSDNVKPGTASIIVSGINRYGGRQKGTFVILNNQKAISSGYIYYLVPKKEGTLTAMVTDRMIKNNATLSLDKRANSKVMRFTFLKTTDGTYKILTYNSLYCLTGGDGGVLKLFTQKNNAYQRWIVEKDSQGLYSFVNKSTGLAITYDSAAGSGSVLTTTQRTDTDEQKFFMLKSSDSFPTETINIGQYNNTYVERIELTAEIKPRTLNSKFSLFKQEAGSMLRGRNSGVFVDFAKKKIGIYKGFASGEAKKTLIEKGIPFSLQAGRSYRVSMLRTELCMQSFTFTDTVTGDAVTVEATFADAGRAWGKPSYVVDTGSVLVSSCRLRNTMGPTPALAIIGDSYVEGATLGKNDTERYASLISQYLNDDVYICSRGSANSTMGVNWFNQYIFETVRPEYMLIAFGMNEEDYEKWTENMKKMISLAEENGITPVLATIPPNGAEDREYLNGVHEEMSAWVRRSGYRYIDIAKALSKNNDSVTFNPRLYLEDNLHPNEAGHRKIYEEFLLSLGDLWP